jgi:hypothetical protein
MKPKLLHWCIIGWIDSPPQLALCTNVRKLEFLFPISARFSSRPGVESIDGPEQVLKVLPKALRVPVVPSKLKDVRVEMK